MIAELDTADLKADVALRQAELQAAQAALAELEAGSRPEEIAASRAAAEKAAAVLAELKAGSRPQEIDAAKAQLIAAEVEQNHMEADWRRAEALLPTNAVAKKDYDQAKAAYDVAVKKHRQLLMQYELVKEGPRKEQIDQAVAALAQAQAQYKLVKEGPRKRTSTRPRRVKQSEASLDLAQVRLGYAKVYSPLDGVVLSKNIEPGEYVAPGTPVVTVADLEHVWLRAYVDEMDLSRVKLEQAARDQHRRQGRQGLPGADLIYFRGGGVHAQDRADRERAGETGVSDQDRHPESPVGVEARYARRRPHYHRRAGPDRPLSGPMGQFPTTPLGVHCIVVVFTSLRKWYKLKPAFFRIVLPTILRRRSEATTIHPRIGRPNCCCRCSI